jgi:hypothetical protein
VSRSPLPIKVPPEHYRARKKKTTISVTVLKMNGISYRRSAVETPEAKIGGHGDGNDRGQHSGISHFG